MLRKQCKTQLQVRSTGRGIFELQHDMANIFIRREYFVSWSRTVFGPDTKIAQEAVTGML